MPRPRSPSAGGQQRVRRGVHRGGDELWRRGQDRRVPRAAPPPPPPHRLVTSATRNPVRRLPVALSRAHPPGRPPSRADVRPHPRATTAARTGEQMGAHRIGCDDPFAVGPDRAPADCTRIGHPRPVGSPRPRPLWQAAAIRPAEAAMTQPADTGPADLRMGTPAARWVLLDHRARLGPGDARRHRGQRRAARGSARTSAPASPGCSGRSTPTRSRWPRSSCSAARSATASAGAGSSSSGSSGSRSPRCCAGSRRTWSCSSRRRALQGVGGALLTPGSLALISGVVPRPRTGRAAIGAWSGLGGIAGRGRAVPRRLAGRVDAGGRCS